MVQDSNLHTPNPYSPVRGGQVERDVHEALVAESMKITDENKDKAGTVPEQTLEYLIQSFMILRASDSCHCI